MPDPIIDAPAPTPAPIVDVNPAPAPVPAPAFNPATPAFTPAPPPQPYSTGGQTQSIKGFFKGVSPAEVGMIALTAAVMITIGFYYIQRIKQLKEEKKSNVAHDVDELKVNVQTMMGPNYQKL